MKITAVLKGHTDTFGRQALYIRIANGKQRTFKKTNIKILPEEWDAKAMQVIGNSRAKAYNQQIRSMIFRKEDDLLTGAKPYPDAELFEYCYKSLNQWEEVKKESTLKQNRSEVKKLGRFTGPVMLSKINDQWLGNYRKHCISLKNKPNTVWKSFKFVRVIINKALKERVIEIDPFELFDNPVYRGGSAMNIQLTHEPCADTLKRWFIAAFLFGLTMGSWLGVSLWNYEEKVLRPRTHHSRTLLRTNHRKTN